jgi:large subunit ribosomal protein L23
MSRRALEPRQVLLRPLVTEKSLRAAGRVNAYTFQVHRLANKVQIRDAVESLFDVKVVGVRTDTRPGKPRRRGWNEFTTPEWKRAVVTLKSGDTLDVY